MYAWTIVVRDGGEEHLNADGKVLDGIGDLISGELPPQGALCNQLRLMSHCDDASGATDPKVLQSREKHRLPEREEHHELDGHHLHCLRHCILYGVADVQYI